MARPVLLNNVDHAALRIATGYGAAYGDAVNQTVVFASEFEALQREYAILMRRNQAGAYRFVVLLGVEADENLYLDRDRWDARYVPALHVRGPFTIGASGDGAEPMIHVDLDHPRISDNGEAVFRDQGGNAPALERAAEALRTIHAGAGMGAALIEAWSDLDLIADVTLQLDLDEGRRVNVPDCQTIDAARFAALGGDALARLHGADLLRPTLWFASSLGNVQHLLDRKIRRDARR